MDHGYRGLYGGLGMRDIHQRKRLKPKQHVLDHMGSTELAANLFRATQTEEKLRRENGRRNFFSVNLLSIKLRVGFGFAC